MAYENYVRDLSYLTSGDLSDLTLNFSDKSWRIHKALVVCHSKWFQKALTGGLVETSSEAITLQDDPVYTNAIDCMVSYIYEAGYNVSKFDTLEPLLHAQVTIIADKYDCASLCKLAKTSFANTVMTVNPSDWAVIAAFVYDYTTTVPPAHVELRNSVISAVAGRHWMLKATLREERVLDVLRSNADLATDLLLGGRHGPKVEGVSEHHFVCDHCHYSHTGSRDCPNITSVSKTGKPVCPKCRKKTGNPIHHTPVVNIYPAFSCVSCDGFHTTDPNDEDLT